MITTHHLLEALLFSMIGIPGIVLLIASITANRFFQGKRWKEWDEVYAYTTTGWLMAAISTLLTIGYRIGGHVGARVIVAIIGGFSLAGAFAVIAAFRAA